MANQRKAPRGVILKSGTIILARLPCSARNLSETGACLEVQATFEIPSTFLFEMPGQPPQTCKVVWRSAIQGWGQITLNNATSASSHPSRPTRIHDLFDFTGIKFRTPKKTGTEPLQRLARSPGVIAGAGRLETFKDCLFAGVPRGQPGGRTPAGLLLIAEIAKLLSVLVVAE